MRIRGPQPGKQVIRCSGCDRECDAVDLIVFGIDDVGFPPFGGMYCSGKCMPPPPRPKNLWQRIRAELGLGYITK